MALRPSFREEQVAIIQAFLRHHWEESGHDGIVLGMSGGLDSSVAASLSAEAVGPSNVLGLGMPLVTEDSGDVRNARTWAEELGISFRAIGIGPMVQGVLDQLEIPETDRIATGNVQARARMITLYQVAHDEERLVVGTGNKSELLTGYFCYDSETRAMTPRGPLRYSELKPGDIVFSMDMKTRQVIETPVRDIHIFPYHGELFKIVNRRVDLLVTPNHRILISRNHGQGPLGFETAESRLRGGVTSVPIPLPWDGSQRAPAVIDTESFLGTTSFSPNSNPPVRMALADFLYLTGLFIGDGHNDVGQVTIPTKSDLSREDRWQFRDALGRFAPVPEIPGHSKTYERQRIFIGAREGNRSRQPLLNLLQKYRIHATETPDLLAFTNRALSAAFLQCGSGAPNKRIPEWILKFPANQLRPLFKGLMDSDGTASGGTYTTTSPRLAYQMVELCAKLGLHAWPSWRQPRTSVYQGKTIRSRGMFDVCISQRTRTVAFTRKNMSRVPYEGKVWCPSVPPFENLLVERHGRMLFCGNTKFGDGGSDFLPLGDLYKTQVRAMARHLGLPERILEKVPSAGLWEGQTDEGELGISYEDLDRVLLGLELDMPPEEIVSRTGLAEETVERVREMVRRSIHKRKMPLIPKVGIRTLGLDWRE